MQDNGKITSIRKYPSPNPHIRLDEITYWSDGLRVKGLLARPIKKAHTEAMLYLRGGMQSIGMVRPARIAQFAMQGFTVFAPYYRGTAAEREEMNLRVTTATMLYMVLT